MTSRYLIRFDDICQTMDWASWERIEALLLRYQVKPILAIVPDNQDTNLMIDPPKANFWGRVRTWQELGWTIGLHGHTHQYVTPHAGLVGLNRYSEFAGLSIDVQREKLASAMARFREEGVQPDAWVAPAHSFDRNTLRVLQDLGISIVSDGFTYRITERYGFRWFPQQLWRFRNLPFGIWTVCLHPNSFGVAAIEELENDLDCYGQQIIGLEEALNHIPETPLWSQRDSIFAMLWKTAIRRKKLRFWR